MECRHADYCGVNKLPKWVKKRENLESKNFTNLVFHVIIVVVLYILLHNFIPKMLV
jgi:hypothetical protein